MTYFLFSEEKIKSVAEMLHPEKHSRIWVTLLLFLYLFSYVVTRTTIYCNDGKQTFSDRKQAANLFYHIRHVHEEMEARSV